MSSIAGHPSANVSCDFCGSCDSSAQEVELPGPTIECDRVKAEESHLARYCAGAAAGGAAAPITFALNPVLTSQPPPKSLERGTAGRPASHPVVHRPIPPSAALLALPALLSVRPPLGLLALSVVGTVSLAVEVLAGFLGGVVLAALVGFGRTSLLGATLLCTPHRSLRHLLSI